ncbi:hypothetical protein [Actinokineospora inagensis]|uniref:hypothetical protein n=1 Tax=Actinokineospora inagensis TaxID=103730 RepID=UPI0003FC019E|nr:hypothetical protein [Actinokineospora inagensis]
MNATEIRVSAGLEVASDCAIRSYPCGDKAIAIVFGEGRDGVEMVCAPESLERLVTVASAALAK